MRASRGSKHVVDAMLKRQEDATRKSREKFLSRKEEREKEERDRIEAVKRERRATLSKPPASIGGPSWQEMQELAAQKRMERIEKRKAEMSMMIVPSAAEARPTRRTSTDALESGVDLMDKGKAEDPSKVVRRLARQQEIWSLHLQRAKVI